jgi:hypothetical protein
VDTIQILKGSFNKQLIGSPPALPGDSDRFDRTRR